MKTPFLSMKKNIFLQLSLMFYVVSLVLPVFIKPNESFWNIEGYGFIFLFCGWMTYGESWVDFLCWFSNIFIFLSWIFYRKKWRIYLSWLGILPMFLYGIDYFIQLQLFEIMYYKAILVGYFFWLGSAILLLFPFSKGIEN